MMIGSVGGRKGCNNCGGMGHVAKECPSVKLCDKCGSPDHIQKDCPNRDKRCDNCGRIGHLKAKCYMEIGMGGMDSGCGKGFGKGVKGGEPLTCWDFQTTGECTRPNCPFVHSMSGVMSG